MPAPLRITFLAAFGGGLSRQEILDAIPPALLETIKFNDPKPYFKAFAIAHEGVATPFFRSESTGEKFKAVVRVMRSAIESLKSRIIGRDFFDDYHAQTSDRKKIAQEVAQVVKDVNGNLHAFSIVYAPPQHVQDLKDKDVVSMESNDFDMVPDPSQQDGFILRAIKNIEAFATGMSKDGVIPAWRGAVEAGAIYAFSNEPTPQRESQEERKRMPDEQHERALFPLRNGMPDYANIPFELATAIVKGFFKAKNLQVSDVRTFDDVFGERRVENGKEHWLGGDKVMREKFFDHVQNVYVKPHNEAVAALEVHKKDLIDLRRSEFKAALAKAAKEEAPKHQFDEKMAKVLEIEIADRDPGVMDDVFLKPKEEREKVLVEVGGKVVKACVDKVRAQWQAQQTTDPTAAAGGAGDGQGATQTQTQGAGQGGGQAAANW